MTQDILLDILILGLLVLLFAGIYRKRATARLRLWIGGWLFTLLHFVVWIPRPLSPFWQSLLYSLGLITLMLTGVCFILAASVQLLRRSDLILLGAGFSLPAMVYIFLATFRPEAILLLYSCALIGEAAAIWLTWRFYRGKSMVLWVSSAAALLCGGWLLASIHLQLADEGAYALLTQLFLMNAVLFGQDFRRVSAGVITCSAGLLAWAAVFPSALAAAHFYPHLHLSAELWNVPKYFVEFGMILTLMENQVYAANWQREQYRLLFDSNPHPMFICDTGRLNFLSVNDAAVRQYGFERAELLEMTMLDLHEQIAAPAIEHTLKERQGSIHVSGPWAHRRKDGSNFLAELSSNAIEFNGCDARLCMVQDVTDRQRMHEQLVYRAHHDSLTDLPNRFLFEERMRHTLEKASRYSHKVAVMCIDLDRFKQINDTYGHAAGDACLREVGARLRARLRESDTVARTGGEEFMVVVGDLLHNRDAEKVAGDLIACFQRSFRIGETELTVSASIGIALYPDHGSEGQGLWRAADLAMYHAKFSGGNQFSVVSEATGQLEFLRFENPPAKVQKRRT